MNSRICESRSAIASGFSRTRPLADSTATGATGAGGTSSRSAGGLNSGLATAVSTGASVRVESDMSESSAALLKALLDTGDHPLQPLVARRIDDVAQRVGHDDASLG